MVLKSKTLFDGKIAVIELRGTLIGDEGTDDFRREVTDFIEQGNKSLIINLAKVNYMNSSGLGAIVSAKSSYKKNDGDVKLAGLTKNVQNLFVITKLSDVFDIYDSVDEAIESLSKKSINKIKTLTNNLQE